MLVEFIGESGCGKSTLARYISENEKDIKLRPYVENISVMMFFVKNFRIKEYRELFILLYGLSLKAFKTKRLVKNARYIIGLLNEHFSDKHDIMLLEQGLVQFLYTVFFDRMIDNSVYKNVLEKICKYFRIYFVFCQCPDCVIQERIVRRSADGKERKRRIEDVVGKSDVMEYHKKIFELLLREIPPERVIRIDTSNELKDNQKLIYEWIRRKYA